MEKFPSPEQAYKLWMLLANTRHAILRVRQKDLHQYGVYPTQAAVLLTIHSIGDKATPAEISRRLFRERHSVSEILTRMEKKGLVRRVKDLERKDRVRIVLTEKGRETYNLQSTNLGTLCDIVSSISEEEFEQLRSCLKKLRGKAVEKLGMANKYGPRDSE